MSEADAVGPSARMRAGLLAHRTWRHSPCASSTRCTHRVAFPLDPPARTHSGRHGRGVASQSDHASLVRLTVAGTAPDSSDLEFWTVDCGFRDPQSAIQNGITGVPFSSRPAGAGARTRSVCERTILKVDLRRPQAQSVHEIFREGVRREAIRRCAGDGQSRRSAPPRPVSRTPGREEA